MRSHSKALFAVAALCAFLLVPSSALAGKPVNDFFGTVGSGNGQFGSGPGGLAVNQVSGDLYVFDQTNSRVQRFDAAGTYLSQFGEPGSGNGQLSVPSLFPPAQIAIDQADGSVYVADPGNNRIQKFEADGTFVSVIDTATGSPVSETFSGPKGVAVGTDGTLYVADTGNNRIVKFDSSGVYLSDLSISVGEGEGELSSPAGLAVDSSGAIYVYESPETDGRVQKFSAVGSFEFILSPGEPLRGVATDTTNDHVFVAGRNDIYEFDATGELKDTHHVDPSGVNLSFLGLAVNDGGGPIYATNINGTSPEQDGTWALILDEPGIPTPSATIDPVTTDSDSATFTGKVNPNGDKDANWRFQISADGGTSWSDVGAGGTVPEGTTETEVSAQAIGLEPSVEYQVRLVASKWFVTAQGIDSTSFTTVAVAPIVDALFPGPVTEDSAWLGAYVNPKNAATTYYVEYSTSPNFLPSASFPAAQDAIAGAGGVLTLAIQLVEGLQPETTYHYRVVANNAAGTTIGESRSFTTAVAPSGQPSTGLPDGRVWEKVSPSFKAGANIAGGNVQLNFPVFGENSRAATDGGAVAFGSRGKFAGGEGAPLHSQYLARRKSDSWTVQGINPPQDPVPGVGTSVNFYQWFSNDLSAGVVNTQAALNPGDPKGVQNLYLRNLVNGSYTTVSNADDSTQTGTSFYLYGASADGEHFVFDKAGSEGANVLWERGPGGEYREVSVLPNNTVVEGYLGSGRAPRTVGFNAISEDGSRIYFSTDGAQGPIYVRENGTDTTLVTASERDGDDSSIPSVGDFVAASADGTTAFFRSPAPLTDDPSSAGEVNCVPGMTYGDATCHDLYRWDSEAPPGEKLTDLTVGDLEGSHTLGAVGISDDGESIYFAAIGDLDGNGSRSQPNLYLWREGKGVRFIGRLAGGLVETDWGLWSRSAVDILTDPNSFDNDEPYRSARITPDGRYVAFATQVSQTAYDTNGKQALYIYDSESGRVTCASCSSVEPKSAGDSWLMGCAADDRSETRCGANNYLSRNFRADGRRLIFDSADALVSQDTNGVADVYEWQDGRLHLLSSGTSAFPSRFVDASESGNDVFFTTAQRLTPSDQDDLRDLYDARVGGVPEPDVAPPCIADECQGTPSPPPAFRTPSSAGFEGAGNAPRSRSRCLKPKVRRKGGCVKRKVKKQVKRNRANQNRRAGR